MSRTIRLTERDLSRIVKRVINEQIKTKTPEHEKLYNEAIGLLNVLTFDELNDMMLDIRKKAGKKIIKNHVLGKD